jgi:hypothetical protein
LAVSAWAAQALDFQPDPVQQNLLDHPAPRLILCCSRQWGKSTVTAIKALHHAVHHPRSLVLVAAPTARQSGEWLIKTTALAQRLGLRTRGDRVSRLGLLLPNGARLVALPGKAANVRGYSAANLIILDEAAFAPDDLYHALRPILHKTAGRLWLLSTPFRQTGFFHREFHHGPAWHRIVVPATDCPRIPPEFLAEERLSLGEDVFQREYMCQFTAPGTQIFARRLLDSAVSDLYDPFNGGKRIWPE